jgi:hypothetical protein
MTWTTERRAKQSQAIRQWKPWAKSTGAKSPEGKAVVSRNAFKGGHRSYMRQISSGLKMEFNCIKNLVNKYKIAVTQHSD